MAFLTNVRGSCPAAFASGTSIELVQHILRTRCVSQVSLSIFDVVANKKKRFDGFINRLFACFVVVCERLFHVFRQKCDLDPKFIARRQLLK